MKVKMEYFLATHFERTRIIDPRIKDIEDEVIEVKRKIEKLEIKDMDLLKSPMRI